MHFIYHIKLWTGVIIMLDDQVQLPVCFSRPRSSPEGGGKSIEFNSVLFLSLTLSKDQCFLSSSFLLFSSQYSPLLLSFLFSSLVFLFFSSPLFLLSFFFSPFFSLLFFLQFIEYSPVTMTPTPSHAQIRFVFSPSPALLAMIPQATPVPQFPSLVDVTSYSVCSYCKACFKLTTN